GGRFHTWRPSQTFSTWLDWTLAANQGRSYGVGLPIILNFSQPVQYKAAVEKALAVSAQKPVPGAWRWVTDEQVVYRAETYWPAHLEPAPAAGRPPMFRVDWIWKARCNLLRVIPIRN